MHRRTHSPVERDGDQREDADVDAQGLGEGAELAHELGELPPLEQRRVELERDAEDGDDDVGGGQVRDVEVGHVLHAARRRHHEDHQAVAEDGQQGDEAVADGEQHDDAWIQGSVILGALLREKESLERSPI